MDFLTKNVSHTTVKSTQWTTARRNIKGGAKTNAADPPDDRLKKACGDFEGIFLNFMFQGMKKTLPGDGVFGNSYQRDMYDAMFLQEISTKLARERGIGIAKALYQQLNGQVDRKIEK